MRFLVKATIPVEAGNELVRDPSFGERLQGILSEIRPEAAYFGAQDGQRAMFLVVEVEGGHRMPAIAEPLWLGLRANVEMIPLITQDDMARAVPDIAQAAKRF